MSVRRSAYRHGITFTGDLPTTSGVRSRQGGESVVLVQSFLSDIPAAWERTPLPPSPDPGQPAHEETFAAAAAERLAAVTRK